MNIKVELALPPLSPYLKPSKGLSNSGQIPDNAIRVDIEDTQGAMTPNGTEFLKYTVKKDEKVADIAEKFGMSPYDLSKFLIDEEGSDTLYEGQEIQIPVYLVKKQ